MDVGERLVKIAEGMYVERDVLNVVAAIHEYDPNLKVKMCARGEFTDAPYILVEKCPDGFERIVFEIWELDHRVLQRVIAADNQRNDILAGIDKKNEKFKLDQQSRYQERMLEANDILSSMFKTRNKNKWTVKDGDRLITIVDRG